MTLGEFTVCARLIALRSTPNAKHQLTCFALSCNSPEPTATLSFSTTLCFLAPSEASLKTIVVAMLSYRNATYLASSMSLCYHQCASGVWRDGYLQAGSNHCRMRCASTNPRYAQGEKSNGTFITRVQGFMPTIGRCRSTIATSEAPRRIEA